LDNRLNENDTVENKLNDNDEKDNKQINRDQHNISNNQNKDLASSESINNGENEKKYDMIANIGVQPSQYRNPQSVSD